jgi:YHS domain-containing protein
MRLNRLATLALTLLLGLLATAAAGAKETATDAEAQAYTGDPYYFDTCPVTGAKLGDTAVTYVTDSGRQLRFCCTDCVGKFEADPQAYLPALDAKIVADQLPRYALTTCPITDEPLDSMGGVVDHVWNNRLVRFCCAGCIDEFESQPEKYVKKLDAAAIAQQASSYPLKTCLVLPDEAYEDEHTIVVAGRVFKLCCGGCEAEVQSNPAEWIAKLDAAWKK